MGIPWQHHASRPPKVKAVKHAFDCGEMGRLLRRQKKFDSIKAPFFDAKEEGSLFLAHSGRPHHHVDAVFHVNFLRAPGSATWAGSAERKLRRCCSTSWMRFVLMIFV